MALSGALASCATESATKADVDALRAELRGLRETDARLSARLDRLENASAVQRARPSSPADDARPDLTVIKLKPKSDPAPRIDTRVDVVEPSPDILRSLARARPEPDAAPPVDPVLADAEYEQAVSALKTGNVEGGVSRLLTFAANNPTHSKADNALYFAGLGQMGLEDYLSAAHTFEKLVADHPAGDAVQDGLLRLAECRVRMNQLADAKVLYAKVASSYPGTAAAAQAEQRLADFERTSRR